jgi:hypothetical protein
MKIAINLPWWSLTTSPALAFPGLSLASLSKLILIHLVDGGPNLPEVIVKDFGMSFNGRKSANQLVITELEGSLQEAFGPGFQLQGNCRFILCLVKISCFLFGNGASFTIPFFRYLQTSFQILCGRRAFQSGTGVSALSMNKAITGPYLRRIDISEPIFVLEGLIMTLLG